MKRSFAVGLSTLLFCAGAFAQVAGMGGISGIVRDASGAAVPDAQVVVSNESKGIKRVIHTTMPACSPRRRWCPRRGTRQRHEAGLRNLRGQRIQLQVGQNVDLKVLLTVAGASTQVQVEATAPIVDSTKTDVSQVIDSNQIQDLPINGRRVDSFVLLSPAVVPDGTFGLVSFRGIAGGNSFLTDGNDTTEQYYNENAGRTRITSQISQDAVQEFQVVSNNYSAEFGRATGGVVNTVTRSGRNVVSRHRLLVFPQSGFQREGHVRHHQSASRSATSSAPAPAARSSRTSCSTSSTMKRCAAISR